MAPHRAGQILIVLASICWSTGGAFQRELTVDTVTQICGRAFVSCLTMVTMTWLQHRGSAVAAYRRLDRTGWAFALCLAGASGMFITALNRTTVANVLFTQAMAPFIAVVLSWLFLHERASRRTWLATAVAVAGVVIMVGGPGSGAVVGFIASGVMTILFALTIVIVRHQREISMAPAVALGQLLLCLSTIGFASFSTLTRKDVIVMVAMGVFQTGLGQVCFVVGARLLPAPEVALITLLEVVLAPAWVWLFYNEHPAVATLIGGAVVLVAVVYQTTEPATPSTEPDPIEPARTSAPSAPGDVAD